MKEKKLKCYPIMIAKYFPSKHPRKGEPTFFTEKILGIDSAKFIEEFGPDAFTKIHTIRSNYPFWEKRIIEVQAGRAYFSLRQWEGRPYYSNQVEILKLMAVDGVGIEKILLYNDSGPIIASEDPTKGKSATLAEVAKRDGLNKVDFREWFNPAPLELCAIIHFTSFRYL